MHNGLFKNYVSTELFLIEANKNVSCTYLLVLV